jgi:hypothetical protein
MDHSQLNIPAGMRGEEDAATLLPPSPPPIEAPGHRLP